MFDHVVVAYDRSEPADGAASIAFALAAGCSAHLTLVHVQSPDTDSDECDLGELAQRAPPGSCVKTLLLRGNAVGELRQLLERTDVDLIVAGTHGTSGIRKALLGSVSRSLLDSALCAVMLVRDKRSALGTGPVVVGLDYSDEARAAAAIGLHLAAAFAVPLLLVHVLDAHIPSPGGEPPLPFSKREDLGRTLVRDVRSTLTCRGNRSSTTSAKGSSPANSCS